MFKLNKGVMSIYFQSHFWVSMENCCKHTWPRVATINQYALFIVNLYIYWNQKTKNTQYNIYTKLNNKPICLFILNLYIYWNQKKHHTVTGIWNFVYINTCKYISTISVNMYQHHCLVFLHPLQFLQ